MVWVTANTLPHIRRAVLQAGHDAKDAALANAAGESYEHRITVDALVAAWETALALTNRREIPAIAADYALHDERSLLAFAVSNRPRFRDAMECFVRYFASVSDVYAWEIVASQHGVQLVAAPPGPFHRLGWQLHLEFEIADCVRSAMRVTAGIARPAVVCFAHAAPPPRTVAMLRDVLGTEPVFDCDAYAVAYTEEALDAPLPLARPALSEVVEARLAALVETSLSARTRTAIDRLLRTGDCNVDAIARALAVSRRSLERGLAAEGTSVSAILDEERKQRALAWLPTRSVEAIAERLGYSDRRAFARAFRRWTGSSPLELRRRRGGTDSA